MSEFFNLPMECASSKDHTGVRCTELADYDFFLADFGYVGCEWPIEKAHEMAEAAAHAINAHDDLVKQNEELKKAFAELLSASIEYIEYEHDGDPDKEDARSMGEMMLNELNEDGSINKFKKLLKESE